MAHTYWKVNAAAGLEFARFAVGVHNSVAFQDEDTFFIGVVMHRRFAGRNPSRELGDLLAAEVRVDQIPESTVLARGNVFAMVFMYQQPRRRAGPIGQRAFDDV